MNSDAIEFYQLNADCFCEDFFHVELDNDQRRVCKAISKPNSRVCYVAANGKGKDAICSMLAQWFLYCFGVKGKPALVPTTSASGRQIDILWKEIALWMHQSEAKEYFDLLTHKMSIKETDGESYALGFKGNDEKTVEGYHADKLLYILTEARGAPEWMFTAILKACTKADNRVLVQSVPGDETGEFFRIASGQRKKDYGEQWEIIFGPAAEKINGRYVATSKLVSQQSIDEKLAYGESSPQFVGPVLARFIPGSSLQLIPYSWFLAAYDRWEETEAIGEDILGIDVAWTGQSSTVFTHRKGDKIIKQWGYQGEELTETARIAYEWWMKYKGWICVEGVGVGAGVISILREKRVSSLILVQPGGPAVEDQRFVQRRDELCYYFAERFREGRIAVPELNSMLQFQCMSIKEMRRGDDRFQVEPKQRLPESPDYFDSAMLTMAAPNQIPTSTINTKYMWSGGQRASHEAGRW